MKKVVLMLALIGFTISSVKCQIFKPVKWTFASKKINSNEAVIFVKATMDAGWHIYGLNVPQGGPEATKFVFTKSKDFNLIGKVLEPKPKSKYEDVFKVNVPFHDKEVIFQQKIKLNSSTPTRISGKVSFMSCDKTQCLPEDDYDFALVIKE
ncbi:MAG: protein-disulfide reductase DsbD domain-containing protein [Sphingobacterium sp.]